MRFAAIVFVLILIGYAAGPGCGKTPVALSLDRAQTELLAGNLAAAKTLLEQSLGANPGSIENASGYNLLGVVHWRLGEIEPAREAFESSRTLDDAHWAPAYNLGILMYRNGDAFRATTLLEEAAQLDESDPRALEYLAHIELERGNWTEAADLLHRALDRAPESPRIHTSLGVTRLHTEGAEAAATEFTRALDADVRYAPASFNLALIHRERFGDTQRALHFIRQYLDTTEDLSRSGEALELLNELSPPSSGAVVEEPARVDPPTTERRWPETITGLIERAGFDAESGRSAEALEACRRAAGLAKEGGDSQIQEWVHERTIALCPREAEAYYGYGMFLVEQDRFAEALSWFKRSVALAPRSIPSTLGMAGAAVRAGEIDAALVAYQRALRVEPANREALWGLARLYDGPMNMPPEAADTYRRILAAHPAEPDAIAARARLDAIGL